MDDEPITAPSDIWRATIAGLREDIMQRQKRCLISLTALKHQDRGYAADHRRLLRLYQAFLREIENA